MVKEKNEVIDWYSIMPKSLQPQYHNPNFKIHGISIPFRCVIVGQSGAKKTSLLLDMIHKFSDTFGNITIITKDASEPLYTYLRSKIDEGLDIYEGMENTPKLENLDPDIQHLIVWDDMCLEKNQDVVNEYMIRGRKVAKGTSCVYISQSWYKIPKTTRLQCDIIILKKVSSTAEIKRLLADYNLGLNPEQLIYLYKECTREQDDFLLIDIKAPLERRFRKNYSHIINIEDV